MEWVYDNQQKETEMFNAYLERFTLLKGIGICLQSIIRKGRNNDGLEMRKIGSFVEVYA